MAIGLQWISCGISETCLKIQLLFNVDYCIVVGTVCNEILL